MNTKRRALRAGAVLFVALGAGHLVQTMGAGRPASEPAHAAIRGIETVAASDAGTPAAGKALLPPAASLTGPAPAAAKETAPPPVPEIAAAPDCTPALAVAAAPGALLSLSLSAPCNGGESVSLRHGGLVIAAALDTQGSLRLDLPAFEAAGQVSALLEGGGFASAAAKVDLTGYRRFAVQWMADDAFQLHALEQGADYGAPGDVHAGNAASPEGGALMRLGDPALPVPMLAEVYTWPTGKAVSVRPVVEAAVTATTCGRELAGETVSLSSGRVTVQDLTLTMPGCDAIGDILVLNNLVPEMTLAAMN
ncbi:hypothetical protein [Pseudogemmobacter humi]|nr:hypothetical protein [Pseudogemmobacter humi]